MNEGPTDGYPWALLLGSGVPRFGLGEGDEADVVGAFGLAEPLGEGAGADALAVALDRGEDVAVLVVHGLHVGIDACVEEELVGGAVGLRLVVLLDELAVARLRRLRQEGPTREHDGQDKNDQGPHGVDYPSKAAWREGGSRWEGLNWLTRQPLRPIQVP